MHSISAAVLNPSTSGKEYSSSHWNRWVGGISMRQRPGTVGEDPKGDKNRMLSVCIIEPRRPTQRIKA